MSSPDLLLAHADRAVAPSATIPAPSRVGTPRRGPARPGRANDPLLGAITAVIRLLGEADGTTGLDEPRRRALDAALREALSAGTPTHAGAVSAVTVACTYLATDDLEDAYFALLSARDLLR